ncbi:MAG: hypothetical protein GC152_14460 [Alphaproteobacteria bacterium]|nr:hypothetical protein [Alphaproteobacteria bacterium]
MAVNRYSRLDVFGVAGGGLGFAAQRLETIARVCVVPIALMLTLDMAAVFGVLSTANGGLISFADLPKGATFATAASVAHRFVGQALVEGHIPILAIAAASVAVNVILVASFMAPLIRYAGLGEKPAPGLVRAPFGPDQARYVAAQGLSLIVLAAVAVAPAWAAFAFIARAIDAALSKTYASFPNADSLHTIDLVPAQEALALRGELWLFSYGYLGALAAAGVAVVFLLGLFHFHPRNRPAAGAGNAIARTSVLAILTAVLLAAIAWLLLGRVSGAVSGGRLALSAFLATFYVMLIYVSLRFAPYAGLAVCSRSMGLGGLFGLSRGWNLFRLAGAFALVALVILLVQIAVEGLILPVLSATVVSLFQASESLSKLQNGGEADSGILVAFVWIWTAILIGYKFLWLFFTYGVWAGFFGRLYRQSVETS